MSRWNEDGGLKWRPREPFGVEIDHDLTRPFTPAAAARFVELFRAHGLITASGPKLTMEQQIAVMSHLGPVLHSADGTTYITTETPGDWVRLELKFHADYAYTQFPLDGLSLHAVDVEDGANSTRFANAERAYEKLPAKLRERLEQYTVEMINPTFDKVDLRSCDVRDPEYLLLATRPTAATNPRSGRRCLVVSEAHATQLNGLSWEESRELLGAVYEHLYAPDNITEQVWNTGDIAIWDNATFQHGRPPIRHAGRRVLQRVVVGPKSLVEISPAALSGDLEAAKAERRAAALAQ
jgi:alpha-ketoglutarate-dependent taurine dioxygenase